MAVLILLIISLVAMGTNNIKKVATIDGHKNDNKNGCANTINKTDFNWVQKEMSVIVQLLIIMLKLETVFSAGLEVILAIMIGAITTIIIVGSNSVFW